jgi:hypothetical protein
VRGHTSLGDDPDAQSSGRASGCRALAEGGGPADVGQADLIPGAGRLVGLPVVGQERHDQAELVGVDRAQAERIARVDVEAAGAQAGGDVHNPVFCEALRQGLDLPGAVGDHEQSVVIGAREAVVRRHGLVDAPGGVGELDLERGAVDPAGCIDRRHGIPSAVDEAR